MKMPNLQKLSFEQYLNIKKSFVKNAIYYLKNTSKRELEMTEEEIKEMLKFQRKELSDVNLMLKYQKQLRKELDAQAKDGEK